MLAAFLTLIRWKNLLLLAFTQATAAMALRAWIPAAQRPAACLLTGLLIASTVLIAAAGYLINDWFDVAIDRINKPGAPLPSGRFPMGAVLPGYAALNLAGIVLAAWAWISAGKPAYTAVSVISVLLLWAYSARWKRAFMIGNVVVALLSALAVIVVLLLIAALAGNQYFTGKEAGGVAAFALFAFLLTWVREIVKDLEDQEGDGAQDCRTMAIRWPLQYNVFFVLTLLFLAWLLMLFLLMAGFAIAQVSNSKLLLASALLFIGLMWLMAIVERMQRRTDFARASRAVKIVMAAGIAAVLWLSL